MAVALYKPVPKLIPPTIIIKEPVAQTSLLFGELSVAASSSAANPTYSFPINIETKKNKVTAVQLELQYDPLVLADVSVVPGAFFKNPNVLLNQIDAKTGRISYAFGVGLTDAGIAGKGTAAIISFEVKPGIEQKTGILFLPKTKVTAENISQSVLKATNNALFTVGIIPSVAPTSFPSAQ